MEKKTFGKNTMLNYSSLGTENETVNKVKIIKFNVDQSYEFEKNEANVYKAQTIEEWITKIKNET